MRSKGFTNRTDVPEAPRVDRVPKRLTDPTIPTRKVGELSKPKKYKLPESKPRAPFTERKSAPPAPTPRLVVVKSREDKKPKRLTNPAVTPSAPEKIYGDLGDSVPSWEDVFRAVVRARLAQIRGQV
jgi:hypothetical protein